MAKRKAQKQQPQELTPLERLGLRVSSMINAPKAQLEHQVTIHQLDTDPDEVWESVLELLAETDGLGMVVNDDGSVILQWDCLADDDRVIEKGDVETLEQVAPF
ncbi:Protein of unknown function [Azotobacter beijerinckii]|uniref:DUF1654 domain-containing protein n=1 Tax=Azotobacter beijerinckii TaxID=170623 RepID=A0A1H6XKY0_9GAMM|nr:DUF1654 domain-containing protein [Azotobacter beijerinckii]SEJ28806.1 Protein of unknown function [Azotobacter beijerinckii]